MWDDLAHHAVTMKIPSACGGVSILQRRPDQEKTPQNLSGVDGDVYVPLYSAPFTAAVVSIMTSCNTERWNEVKHVIDLDCVFFVFFPCGHYCSWGSVMDGFFSTGSHGGLVWRSSSSHSISLSPDVLSSQCSRIRSIHHGHSSARFTLPQFSPGPQTCCSDRELHDVHSVQCCSWNIPLLSHTVKWWKGEGKLHPCGTWALPTMLT